MPGLSLIAAAARPPKLSDDEVATLVELRSADPKTWSWQTLADRFNEARSGARAALGGRTSGGRDVNYRATVAAIRTARDREIARVTAEHWDAMHKALAAIRADARREIEQLTAARDAEIRRLRSEGLSLDAIAAEIGCNRGLVYEIIDPAARERYNRRRREHWRTRPAGPGPVRFGGRDDRRA